MDRCPNCKATNPGINQCRRCGVELARLQDIEAKATRLILQALRLLLLDDPDQTCEVQYLLARSEALRHDHLVTVLQGFVTSPPVNSDQLFLPLLS